MKKKYAAIVLSAGKGKRMNTDIPKQYLMLEGKPVLTYSLEAFERSMVEEIVLVAGKEDIAYCREEIIAPYHLKKVKTVIPGGKERYHSVFCGLKELAGQEEIPDYVMVHDGARPFVDQEIITRCAEAVEEFGACVAGMPVKDTIKIADEEQFAVHTPRRSDVWMVQTPQVFEFDLLYHAYEEMIRREKAGEKIEVTDDAMVVETVMGRNIRLVEASYRNIKITTPEDMAVAKLLLCTPSGTNP